MQKLLTCRFSRCDDLFRYTQRPAQSCQTKVAVVLMRGVLPCAHPGMTLVLWYNASFSCVESMHRLVQSVCLCEKDAPR